METKTDGRLKAALPASVDGCVDCPHQLANPATISPEVVERYRRHQRACQQRRQQLTAHGARFTYLDPPLTLGDLRLDRLTRVATRGTQTVRLTDREFSLLAVLMREPGQTCSREQILHAWNNHGRTDTKVVEMYINRLREKIDKGFATQLIHNDYGNGYVMRAE